MKTYVKPIIIGSSIILAALGAWFFLTVGEWVKPEIRPLADLQTIGRGAALKFSVTDGGSGLSSVAVTITQDDQVRVLSSLSFRDGKTKETTVSVPLDAGALRLRDGQAVLTVVAEDRSLWKNKARWQKTVSMDLDPPRIALLTTMNHLSPGGTGVVLYTLSKPVTADGVWVDDVFFPSYAISQGGRNVRIVYFAVPMDSAAGGPRIRIAARDGGGNEAIQTVPRVMLKKTFRHDKMTLSDAFLEGKTAEFVPAHPPLREKTPLERFVYINTSLREENFKTIQAVCAKSEPRQLWEGPFLRMKDAAPMALFGDRRTYLHGGKAVGESVHMGVDLASLAQAPVEAANSGLVVFTGNLGIYGNTVIIDHGLGLFSLYAHLSQIDVRQGQRVKKGEVVGRSGMTGLAGGDHLHFSLVVGGRFVDPKEWWDPHWIKDNVTKKLELSWRGFSSC